MEWRDTGIVLSARRHGESGVLLSLLTADHGRHHGLVRGGGGKAARGLYQPGNVLSVLWKARLEDQLGLFSCELLEANAAAVMADGDRLAALASACALTEATLAERDPHPAFYDATLALMAALSLGAGQDGPLWAAAYVRWELLLLAEMGFGLDLGSCAATGATEDLVWVSPRSGRAVSAEAGRPYAEKLLPLPTFLIDGEGVPGAADVLCGLRLSGWFIDRHLLGPHRRKLPPARERLVERLNLWSTDASG